MHYLDNAATSPACDEAAEAAIRAIKGDFANPSSGHALGIRAEGLVTAARREVARALGCKAEEVYFTSGGTEANNWAIFSTARLNARLGRHIITTVVEHPAVMSAVERLEKDGWEITKLPVSQDGKLDLDAFGAAIREDTVLVSVMFVNNETGAVLPVKEAAAILKRKAPQALFHTDAVQGFLKMPFTPASLGVDLLTVSAHKIHGLKGAGALYVRSGVKLPPFIYGGGQEKGLRSGTEAVPAIAAFGAAAKKGADELQENMEHAAALGRYLTESLGKRLPNAVILAMENALPNILSVSLPKCPSEVTVRILESSGVYVGSGSACSRGRRSRTLTAMGIRPEIIDGVIRISLSYGNTREDIDALIDGLEGVNSRLKGRS